MLSNPVPNFCSNSGTANWAWSGGQFTGGFGNSSLVTWNVTQNTSTLLTVSGTISVQGANPTIGLWAGLSLDVLPPGTSDFSNTASVGLQLPTGVSMSSASGVFGSANAAAAPEPSSLLLAGMFGLGLALMGLRNVVLRPVRLRQRVYWSRLASGPDQASGSSL